MDRYMIVIPSKNRAFSLKCDDGEGMKQETLTQMLGGPVKPVATRLEAAWAREKGISGIMLLVNGRAGEEGRPENERATKLADGGETYFGRKPVKGPAILTACRDGKRIGFGRTVAEDLLREWG